MATKIVWIAVFLSKKTVFAENLMLSYGFENKQQEFCYDKFPFNSSHSHIILKDPNATTIWYQVNSGSSDVSAKRHYISGNFLNNSLSLCFWNLSRMNIGNYCLKDVKSDSRIQFYLDIYYVAKIRSLSDDLNIEEYRNVSLKCEVDSNPTANITWLLPHNEVVDRGQLDENNSTISINNCTCQDTGKYICLATNKVNTFDKKELFLNITCGPKFQNKHRSYNTTIYIGLGENLKYSINFTANPSPVEIENKEVNVTIISLAETFYALSMQKNIFHAADFKIYTIGIRNNIDVAKLSVHVLQKDPESSAWKIEWYFIVVTSVGSIILVSGSVSVIFLWKRKRNKKTKKTYNNEDYRDNVLYEPTPIEFLSRIQRRLPDSISTRSSDSEKCQATNSANKSDKEYLKKEQLSKQRKKPKPTPRRQKQKNPLVFISLNKDFQNEVEDALATTSSESLQDAISNSVDCELQKSTPNSKKMKIFNFSQENDINSFHDGELSQKNISTTTINKSKCNDSKEDTRPLNYIEVKCKIPRKSDVVCELNNRSEYHVMLNDSGVIVPVKFDNRTNCDVLNKKESVTKFKVAEFNKEERNIHKGQVQKENDYISNKERLDNNRQDFTDPHVSLSCNASKQSYIYRWRIEQNSNDLNEEFDADDINDNYVNCAINETQFHK